MPRVPCVFRVRWVCHRRAWARRGASAGGARPLQRRCGARRGHETIPQTAIFAPGCSLSPLLLHPRVGSGTSSALFLQGGQQGVPRISGGRHPASRRWVSQALLTFPAQQRALGRIASCKTDLWIGFFISFAAKHKGTTSPHSYKTTTVGDADGQALCGEPCPAPTPFLRLWERGATAPRLPPASLSPTPGSRHSPSGLLQNTPCTLLGENSAVWRGGALRPAPRGALFGSVVNWRR